MRKTSAQFCNEPHPKPYLAAIIRQVVFSAVPHLTRELQLEWLAGVITQESGEPVSASTLRRWWDAKPDDRSGVDSRHMDWARRRDRQMAANDNRLPCSSEVRAA